MNLRTNLRSEEITTYTLVSKYKFIKSGTEKCTKNL